MNGDKEKAVEQWKKAKEMGKDSEILNRKIAEQQYTEDLDPEKRLYRQLESTILDHLHIHPRAHLLTRDIQIHVQPGRQGTELEGLILHRLEELIMSLHASGFHRPDFLGRFTACQHRK